MENKLILELCSILVASIEQRDINIQEYIKKQEEKKKFLAEPLSKEEVINRRMKNRIRR